MRYWIEHETVLQYHAPIREHHIELRLIPRCDGRQRVHCYRIETDPGAPLGSYTDCFGNRVDYLCVIPPHQRLLTRLRAEVEVSTAETPSGEVAPQEQQEWYLEAFRRTPALHDFVLHRRPVTLSGMKLAQVLPCAFPSRHPERPALENLMELLDWVPKVLEYRQGTTGVHADLATAVRQGGGVCQDFAHLFISVARSWGIPTRYVMGYLYPDHCEEELSTHAWAESLVPGVGWLGFDATHGVLAGERHVAVAVGRDSFDAAPQRGSFKGESTGELPSVRVTMQQQQ